MGYSRRSHSLAALFNERSCRWVRPTLSRAAARHHPRLAANQQPPLISTTTNSCPPINAKQWRRLPAGWWWRRCGLPGLLIGLSSPLLRREGGGRLVAGWAGRGQANGGAVRGRDGQSWTGNCASASLSSGPDTLSTERQVSPGTPILAPECGSACGSVHPHHPSLSQLGPSINRHPGNGDTPASSGLQPPSIIWKFASLLIHEFLQ